MWKHVKQKSDPKKKQIKMQKKAQKKSTKKKNKNEKQKKITRFRFKISKVLLQLL